MTTPRHSVSAVQWLLPGEGAYTVDINAYIDALNTMATNEITLAERVLNENQDQVDRMIARDAAKSVIETARAILSLPLEAAA